MFFPEDVANASSKLMDMLFAGNIICLPVSGIIIERFGYTTLYVLMAVMSVASLLLYLVSLGVARSQGVAVVPEEVAEVASAPNKIEAA